MQAAGPPRSAGSAQLTASRANECQGANARVHRVVNRLTRT
ncbi:hypothetical protein DB32_001795 [Sandaracinus amylolyticus]|uniref:Uncharacterized protein n=1 Tax=Sandaracinus amylolyticus TaxID=927083 RepID=A0A0F6W160_9BACT|nr:hypothetical protein DB32_001795 [Sandaracinus amylolyticus]